ncbi:Hypothetical predicted protein [Lecanosticta acicola]|uniref:Uncharacterized protein n=1 Tax=Lecanosticta acicola TaxID=111012 RepID=A0AAI9EEU6_9PEZI|nr:Hypothetical predicted protein [Lecanosticta acicola]
MKVNARSEWMKAQKHADVMAPGGHFEVIQTHDETSIFFSLGTDGVLYATKEVQTSTAGFTREDLSSGLSSRFNGKVVTAKAFSVSQNAFTGKWDLLLAATCDGSDHLFVSQGNSYDTSTAATPGIAWSVIPFDGDGADSASTNIQIADVFALNSAKAGSICVVDIWRSAGSNNSLDRYYVISGHSPQQWNQHLLAIDLDAGSVSTVLGQRSSDSIPGLYTFGMIDGQSELIYAPIYNFFRPSNPPSPARLALPAGTTSMSAASDRSGHTNLFVSHVGGLSVFPPSGQRDGATPVPCLAGPLVSGATQLQSYTVESTTSVWGRNAQGGLFYATCPAGNEAQQSSWSTPALLLPLVEAFAFYNGISTNSHTLFAHISGQDIRELDQDPVTSMWRERKIMLPSTDINDMVEFDSYTTRLEVLDSNSIPQPNVGISLTSISPVPVFVDEVYYVLNPSNPITFKTDGNGSVTIVQQTDSLAAVCYMVAPTAPNSLAVLVDPSATAVQKLNSIQSGDDLAAVRIADSDGVTRPLLPSSTNADDRNAAAQAIKQFCDIGKGLDANGTPSGKSVPAVKSLAASPQPGTHVFSVHVDNGTSSTPSLAFSTREASAAKPNTVGVVSKESIGGDLVGGLVKVGDFFKMLANAALSGLHTLSVRIIDGVHHVFATIGGVVYHALLDCISAVVHAVEWVFRQVKVLLADLISWLGFIFGWKDIVRTHSVVKNLIKQYVRKSINEIGTVEAKISDAFDGLEKKLNAWTDVTDPGLTIGSMAAARDLNDGGSSPQSHWGINHARSQMNNAKVEDHNSVVGGLETVLHDMEALVTDEIDDIKNMITQIRTQIVEAYSGLTPIQIVKRLLGIIGDLLLKSAKNVIVKSLDIIRALADSLVNVLDAPITIPILSRFYKELTGADLSILDLVVLILSIPGTIMYKIAVGSAPFPDDEDTAKLANATDFQIIQDIANPGPHGAIAMPMIMPTHPQKVVVRVQADTRPSLGAKVYRAFAIFGRFFGVVTTWLGQIVQDAKWAIKQVKGFPGVDGTPTPWKVVGTVNSIVGVVPTIINAFNRSGAWEVIMTDTIAGLGLLRTLIGLTPVADTDPWKKSDPYVSVFFQLTQIPPPVGNIIEGSIKGTAIASDYVGLAASLFGRFTGILNPVSMALDDLEVELVIVAAANITCLLQGLLMISNAGMVIAGK